LNKIEANALARFYPWEKAFYAGFGLGIHSGIDPITIDGETLDNSSWIVTRIGFDIVPELGWKIV
jgi:hypothetical protein